VVHYQLSKYDQTHVRTAVAGAARVLQAAGATEVVTSQYRPVRWLPDRETFDSFLQRLDAAGFGVHDMVYGSWHQMGTCRMGKSADSVVDQFGEVRALPNVFVADGSLFPSASGVNPMISIAALAYQIAGGIDSRLPHGDMPYA
jgi:choline dehydrogenase-like flavoprotein